VVAAAVGIIAPDFARTATEIEIKIRRRTVGHFAVADAEVCQKVFEL